MTFQQHLKEKEEKFDENFYEGERNSVYCKKHKVFATPYELKAFSKQSLIDTLGWLENEAEKLKLHKARHSNDQNIYNSGIEIVIRLISTIKNELEGNNI